MSICEQYYHALHWLIKLHRDYVPLVNLIGIFFQIRDDLMNLQSPLVLNPHHCSCDKFDVSFTVRVE